MQKEGLTFDFSRPLPVSEDQQFNHLPLSFTLAFSMLLCESTSYNFDLSQKFQGPQKAHDCWESTGGFLNSPAAVQSTDVPSVDLDN